MQFRSRFSIVARSVVVGLYLSALPLAAQDKQPVPSADAQAATMKLVKDVFGEEYAAAEAVEEKAALAMKMLRTAMEATEPTNRFALLRVAKDIATDAGDGVTAFRAIAEMDRTFHVDVIRMKASVLYSFSKQAKSTTQHKSVAEESLKLVSDAVAQDQFDMALKIVEVAVTEARSSRDGDLLKEAVARNEDVETRTARYTEYAAALAKLEPNPTDPDANLTVGKYHCFFKENWAAGLPMLVLGSDAELKKLAEMELGESPDALALGDGWWGVEEDEAARQRATCWYKKALPGLTGLLKEKVEKRVSELERATRRLGEPLKHPVKKVSRKAILRKNAAPDAVKIGDHYYKVYRVSCSWQEALNRCNQMGGYLACCETREEQDRLAALRKRGVVWIGGVRDSSGSFKWGNGTTIPADRFHETRKGHNYVAFTLSGRKLNTRKASGILRPALVEKIQGFICEWDE